jgi:hypothetical protein
MTTKYEKEQQEVKDAVAAFTAEYGDEFGLRAYPGKRFSVVEGASYLSHSEGVLLYVYVLDDDKAAPDRSWMAFAKGTADELRREVVRLTVLGKP